MSDTPDEIERMVRQVMARLEAESGNLCEPEAAANSGRELHITQHVVSLAQLEGKLDGVGQVVVDRRAVVTPAARDVLRQRNVAVAYTDQRPATSEQNICAIVGTVEATFDATGVLQGMTAGGVEVRQLSGGAGLAGNVAEMADDVASGRRVGILLTGRSAVAACLFNRRQGIRAILGTGRQKTAEDARSTGANVLVLNPDGRSTSEIVRIATEFCRTGPRDCPGEYRQQLA